MLGALFEQDNEDNWENLPEIETASQNVTNFKNKSKVCLSCASNSDNGLTL